MRTIRAGIPSPEHQHGIGKITGAVASVVIESCHDHKQVRTQVTEYGRYDSRLGTFRIPCDISLGRAPAAKDPTAMTIPVEIPMRASGTMMLNALQPPL